MAAGESPEKQGTWYMYFVPQQVPRDQELLGKTSLAAIVCVSMTIALPVTEANSRPSCTLLKCLVIMYKVN